MAEDTLSGVVEQVTNEQVVGAGFARGAIPSPRHVLLSATPHKLGAFPPQFAVVPKQLSMWGNQTYGDCVTAEEAYAKACWSIMCGLPETFITEQHVIDWANKHGFLNGANLVDVLVAMQKDGLQDATAHAFLNGGYNGVDYSNEMVLQSAIFSGPVKIAIDANALPPGAGNQQGWYSISGGNYPSTDHCVGLSAYGTAKYLYEQLGVALPSGLDPNTPGYLLFTWNTIGFVTHAWIMGTVTEAWVRNPTTVGQVPPTPVPVPPTPTPVPVPPIPPTPTHFVGAGSAAIFGFPITLSKVNLTLQPAAVSASIPWIAVYNTVVDSIKLVSDIKAGNAAALEGDFAKLIADFKSLIGG